MGEFTDVRQVGFQGPGQQREALQVEAAIARLQHYQDRNGDLNRRSQLLTREAKLAATATDEVVKLFSHSSPACNDNGEVPKRHCRGPRTTFILSICRRSEPRQRNAPR